MIQPETLRRIAGFLAQYVHWHGSPPEPQIPVIVHAIDLLISEEVMTAEEIRREALQECSVIIPAELFPQKVTGHPLPDSITE